MVQMVINKNPYAIINLALHGAGGWYNVPDIEHYICHHVYMKSTRSERIVDAVELLPYQTKIPFVSSADHTSMADADLMETLLHPNHEAPFS